MKRWMLPVDLEGVEDGKMARRKGRGITTLKGKRANREQR